MNNEFPSSKVICHSKAPNGDELITLEIELHRYILSEFNTHRSLSRNFQSSRAVPVEKMIQQVRDNPAMPVHWGANQRGMVADKENNASVYLWALGVESSVEDAWKMAATHAVNSAECLNKAGYHKQIVNRLLEPFMKTKGVVTATREAFEALFLLRCHKDAQPEFKLLAERMRASIEASKPQDLDYGDYHLPYVDKNHCYSKKEAIQVSTSCSAQVSYRVLDDSLEKALKIYDMLNLPENGVYREDAPHFSPTEHVAKVVEATWMEEREEGNTTYYYPDQSGNFNSISFWQYRKALEIGLENEFIND